MEPSLHLCLAMRQEYLTLAEVTDTNGGDCCSRHHAMPSNQDEYHQSRNIKPSTLVPTDFNGKTRAAHSIANVFKTVLNTVFEVGLCLLPLAVQSQVSHTALGPWGPPTTLGTTVSIFMSGYAAFPVWEFLVLKS